MDSKIQKSPNSRLFVVTGPSGAGKTTLVTQLIKQTKHAHSISRLITCTTRTPRPGEQHGIDYHFASHQEFQEGINQGQFLEWSNAYGNYYGTPHSTIQTVESGQSIIAVVDRAGAYSIAAAYTKSVIIWIDVPNIQALRQRLLHRSSENKDDFERRLQLAHAELTQERQSNLYQYRIMNDVFHQALQDLIGIITQELKNI